MFQLLLDESINSRKHVCQIKVGSTGVASDARNQRLGETVAGRS